MQPIFEIVFCAVLVVFAAEDPGRASGAADDASQQAEPGYTVTFEPGPADSSHAPRFSPKGTKVTLAPADLPKLEGKDYLTGRILVGSPELRGEGHLLALGRSEEGKPYDLLWIDSNSDGSLADEKPIRAKPNVVRDKWWSSFKANLKVKHAASGDKSQTVEYPISLWAVVEKPDATPDVIRFSREGFMLGATKIDDAQYTVAICDGENDGLLAAGDYWAIARVGQDPPLGKEMWRTTSDFHWAGGKAWKLQPVGTSGLAARVVLFDPGITQLEDELKRDHYKVDRDAPRAAKPVAFETDFEEALKKAAAAGRPCYVKFETDWCGPCKLMATIVFTAKDVADAADGIVCVVVDGDKRKDLTERFKVGSYPTGVMLDAKAQEIGRTNGYQGVRAMSEFLRKHKS
jgi:thiol-disulfide isomerase/thioredoxin